MADAAMKQSDTNGDGILDQSELAKAPGLKAAAEAEGGSADKNGDGKLTRDEIRDRIAFYEERATGYDLATIKILVGKQPLGGAEVKLVPEPFLSGVLEEASATTRDEDGLAKPQIPGVGFEGVRPGMYRVQVTHPSGIPAKYNENTTLGIELAPTSSGYASPGPTVFELERS